MATGGLEPRFAHGERCGRFRYSEQLADRFPPGVPGDVDLEEVVSALEVGTDAGEAGSWELTGNVGSRVRSIVLHPDYPAEPVLYAGTVDGVMMSEDLGVTWQSTGPSGETMLAISPGYATDRTLFAGGPKRGCS